MMLVHYAAEPIQKAHSVQQPKEPAPKPNGLWLSVDDFENNWPEWCQSQSFGLDRLTIAHDIALAPTAAILKLASAVEIDQFTADYAKQPEWRLASRYTFRGQEIDWHTVAKEWDGIIIAPYVWQRRLHDGTSWYYGWDCASGCIWNATAIESLVARPTNLDSQK